MKPHSLCSKCFCCGFVLFDCADIGAEEKQRRGEGRGKREREKGETSPSLPYLVSFTLVPISKSNKKKIKNREPMESLAGH